MNVVRGLILWLGAAVIGSFGCTALWQIAGGGLPAWGTVMGLGVVTLFWTITGSTLLLLVFSAMPTVPVWGRYLLLVPLGAVAGAIMLSFGGWSSMMTGAAYGTATALAWVGLHRLTFGVR